MHHSHYSPTRSQYLATLVMLYDLNEAILRSSAEYYKLIVSKDAVLIAVDID